jgi:solute carrier family 13 (sodium-dependent dicarboxylate transporter), member 2/3/5
VSKPSPMSIAQIAAAPRAAGARRWRSVVAAAIAGSLCIAIATAPALQQDARIALIVFVLAIAAWTATRLPETPVALATGVALVAFGAVESGDFFDELGDEVVWLLIGAFAMAAVVRRSGLAERWVLRAAAGSGSVRALFHRLTAMIAATAFVIPSTSGRAALLLPVFVALAAAINDNRIVRALALLFPSAILLSACASLLGAGAHLIALEAMAELELPTPGFLDWALLATPVALLTCAIATELILRLFLDADMRRATPSLPAAPSGALDRSQRRIAAIVAAVIALWASSGWHGLDPALVALLGALALANRRISDVGFKDAMKDVEWNLILFLAATLVLGEALMETGAAEVIATAALAALPQALLAHPAAVTIVATLLAMFSHLLITSRSARAAVLIPTLALPLALSPAQAAPLIVLVTIASGFCQTLRVSAKPVALFRANAHYDDRDLLRLSLWLMPPFALVLVLCALTWWPLLGLGA